jgi:hypothetical protein
MTHLNLTYARYRGMKHGLMICSYAMMEGDKKKKKDHAMIRGDLDVLEMMSTLSDL